MLKTCAVCKKQFDPKKTDRIRVEIRKYGKIEIVWFCSTGCLKKAVCGE